MKKTIVIAISSLIIIVLVIANIGVLRERFILRDLQRAQSHIIGMHLNTTSIATLNIEHTSTLLCIVSPDCQSCYVKLNKLKHLKEKDKRFASSNLIVLVVDDSEDQTNIDEFKKGYDFQFVNITSEALFGMSRYLSINQTYILNKDNQVVLVGDMLKNNATTNIFANYLTAN